MPSTYAHAMFGRTMQAYLPAAAAETVRANRALYDIGLHGPDLFFYYKPLKRNAVNAIGSRMHAEPARVFFGAARARIPAGREAAARAYLLGFLCHFALDAACHSYIENKIRLSGVAHTEIESEFDRFLLLREGIEPLSARLTSHIVPSAENAQVIAPLFGIRPAQAEKALRSMIFYNRLLRAPHLPKRALVCAALKLSGNYAEMHGMMIARKPLEACRDSNLRLEKLFRKAIPACEALMCGYWAYLEGEGALPAAFDATFGHARGWRTGPVLSVEEERKYEP